MFNIILFILPVYLAPLLAPTNVNVVIQGKSSVRVTWKPPGEQSVKGFIRGYKVGYTSITQ